MTEMKKIDLALEKMKEHGFKYTKRREMLLSFLAEADKYTSAKEVYEYMSQQFSGISYDTIYRNLKDFSDIHLLEETEWDGEKKFKFHCDHHEMGHHHHFICTNCGATREIHMCPMDYFKEQLAGCKIEGHRFEIFGKCENCLVV